MAKCKRSKGRPQPKHKKSKKSQHDKRKRLDRRNRNRRKTTEAKVPLTGALQKAVAVLQAVMDPRIAFRLAIVQDVSGHFRVGQRRDWRRAFPAKCCTKNSWPVCPAAQTTANSKRSLKP